MLNIKNIFLLLILIFSFSGCYHHSGYYHNGYYGYPYYYSSYPVVYQYVPVSPVVMPVILTIPQ